MKSILSIAAVVLLSQLVPGRAAEYSEDVRDLWRGLAPDETSTWSEAAVTARKADVVLSRANKKDGYVPLFGTNLTDAVFSNDPWLITDGVLAPSGRGDIWTGERYGDFLLDLEFQCEEDSNSGVFIRCDDIGEWLHTAIEVQIHQAENANGRHNCGGVFDCMAPSKRAIKAAGEWNHYIIVVEGPRILVVLNRELVLDMDLDQWTDAGLNPDGTKNKFKHAYRDMAREGFIGLQEHGQPIRFRNVRIKPL